MRKHVPGLPEAQQQLGRSTPELDDQVVRVPLIPKLAKARHRHQRLPQVARRIGNRDDEPHMTPLVDYDLGQPVADRPRQVVVG